MLIKHVRPRKKLLLNCDIGEGVSFGSIDSDETIMPWIDMANIACGFHAGNSFTMAHTVKLAKQHNTQIGAHPSYPDVEGFGRRSMQLSTEDIISLMQAQLGALNAICQAQGVQLNYVKPHGAFYNDIMRDELVFKAVLQSIAEFDQCLPLMILATTDNHQKQSLAAEYHIDLLFEAFADRAYDDNGLLASRALPNAVFGDEQQILEQALLLATQGKVISQNGQPLQLDADTICLHGDNPASVRVVQPLRTTLDNTYGDLR